jgi:hypothetical protein
LFELHLQPFLLWLFWRQIPTKPSPAWTAIPLFHTSHHSWKDRCVLLCLSVLELQSSQFQSSNRLGLQEWGTDAWLKHSLSCSVFLQCSSYTRTMKLTLILLWIVSSHILLGLWIFSPCSYHPVLQALKWKPFESKNCDVCPLFGSRKTYTAVNKCVLKSVRFKCMFSQFKICVNKLNIHFAYNLDFRSRST